MTQDLFVFLIGALLGVYWLQRASRPIWVPFLSSWLLRHGRVRLAMRLRFGNRSP